ncbi:pyridoxamine 5'-phosphate oxidase family protein [Neobacillus niacini]|uniref:pyridoxamine 5'-phosphate oxidase family protein n=1 Tax=Neobacillus niacini TaxID=86668 RepID=UPI0021CAFD65|nr:pyridoxamine 5'-phosphate oxidase family protein [Neobacillus niacini]MCM3764460.1 pyridoxamine 5'-phosphate oxidase family protein [Neobacillus niacini]
MTATKQLLDEKLIQYLQGERIVTLVTIDKEQNVPMTSTISWLVAQNDCKTIKFAVGHNASSVQNIQYNPFVLLNVVGPDSTYEIKGRGAVSEIFKGRMKFRVVTVEVETVTNNMFYGGVVTAVASYKKTYDANLAAQIDQEIYDKIKN